MRALETGSATYRAKMSESLYQERLSFLMSQNTVAEAAKCFLSEKKENASYSKFKQVYNALKTSLEAQADSPSST